MLNEKVEQTNFYTMMDIFEYDSEVSFLEREIKTNLLKGDLKYKLSKIQLKEWFCKNLFSCDYLENISNEDLYFVAEEKCNIKLMN